jgi:two-component system OmpR family response regulator
MFRILIVEDDTELCQLFSHVLEKNGYHTRMVSNGQEALDALAEEYVDLIISDIMMPVMDGYELVRSLRKKSVMTPVLMIIRSLRKRPYRKWYAKPGRTN